MRRQPIRRWVPLAGICAILLASPGCASTYRDASAPYDDSAVPAGAYASVDVRPYYDALAPYGVWVDVAPYGWAWCPVGISAGWQPYTVGQWVYTDWGWTWVSADPWGTVPYHYGRWAFDASYGWVWVPGDVWAPAWVAWRYGGGYVGWAPLPPEAGWRAGVGLTLSFTSIDRQISPYEWCFVSSRDFLAPRVDARLVPPSRNVTIVRGTKGVVRYRTVESRPAERGLSADWVARAVGRPIKPYRIVDAPKPSRGEVRGNTVQVFRSRIDTRQALASGPPREYRSPSRAQLDREQREQRDLSQRMTRMREDLERRQEQERKEPPRGMSRKQLEKRQDDERRAQRDVEERQRKLAERRESKFRGRGKGGGA